ncbi:cyclic AMP-dependent transcription factor ATF-2-like isoform X2 [Rhopilema esculentum]|uniref:cyclic AMP-dependent transcription factor ATF-2-like isoform X2 n=1 Tax=Rhopilema esculentum TaxID=499914 RepID=UPI0031DFAF94
MDNDDKPFVCPAPDCGQRFTNSDHLSVHQQKHQLSLNIGLRQGESLIDQTPTPTRFLPKTTEEGGELFEGLAESNPFDQDFKKAALSHVPSAPTSVLLPVISVSPPEPSTTDVTKTTASNVRFSSEKELLKSIPQTNIKILDVHSGQTKKIQEGGAGNVTIVVNTQKSLSRVNPASILNSKRPTTVLIQGQSNIQPIIINQELRASGGVMPMIGIKTSSGNGSGRAAVPHPAIVMSRSHQNGTTDLKQRLKEVIQQNATASSSSPSPKSRPSPNHSMQHSSASSPSNSVKSDNSDMMNEDFDEDMKGVPSKRSRRSQEDLDPDERRQKFLERNRAAASRCRQKRKVWVQQLEKKADDLSSTNVALQNEISVLRTEVAQLKALLLAHKDCPITMQQQKALIKQTNPNFGDQSESSIVAVTSLNQQRFETAEEVASSALTDMANQGQLVEPCKGRSMTGVSVISVSNSSSVDTAVIAN